MPWDTIVVVVNRGSQCPGSSPIHHYCASIRVVNANGDGEYEDLFNKDLIALGLARTTFSHACRRECERLREETEERGAGLWRLL